MKDRSWIISLVLFHVSHPTRIQILDSESQSKLTLDEDDGREGREEGRGKRGKEKKEEKAKENTHSSP